MKLSNNSELVFRNRYAINEDETWQELSERVGRGAAQVEPDFKKWSEEFSHDIYNMLFLPGGRILRNIGRPRGSLFNCYCINVDDTIESIAYSSAKALILWSEGGGVGFNFNSLRPEDAPIIQKGGESTGPLSFMNYFNAGAETIRTGGARRAAALGLMLCNHPDIMKYIKAKEEDGLLSNFNISVGVTEKFLEAVESNSDWDLTFNQKRWNTIKSKDLWDMLLNNMIHNGEPGLINWDNLRSNNSWYFAPICGTNPCGEAVLSNMEVCDLGSLVLPNFITGSKNTNWQLMEKTVNNAVRLLDNIIQINRYVIDEVRTNAFNSRRIGVGVMGLAEYLFAKKIKYGSEEAIQETERLMRNIRNYVYSASIKLAEEKEPFPKFDSILYSKSHFVRNLPAKIRTDIKKFGIRNVTGMALAPTGTISLIPEVTSSIEPLFCKSYLRHDQISDRAYIHPIYKNILENNEEMPDWYVDTVDLKPEDHFEMQSACQKYTDGAVSKTINCPRGFGVDQLNNLLLEYIRDLKGVTLYVDGSRGEQILNPLTEEETKKYLEEGNVVEDQEERRCSNGACEI
jgi:ribonucleoside-diphosphate reductase alpha chain